MKLFSTKRFGVKLLVVFVCFLCISTAFGAASDVDLTFGAHPSKDINYTGGIPNGSMIVQPDGKVLIWGGFRVVNGVAVNRLIRLNTDGSIDPSFNCSECSKISMSNALLQPDGKIIVAGARLVGSFSKSKTIRVNSDGSLDNSFSVQFSETLEAVNYGTVLFGLQADGKIFIGQNAQQGGQSGVTTYRLNSNGSIDTSFTSFLTNTRLGRGFVSGITQLPDGKLYVYGATSFGAITRLNPDGTEDTTYEKPSFTNDIFQVPPSVASIAIQADGKIVIAGTFVTINGISKRNFARLSPGGNLDLNFTELPDSLGAQVRQYSDGKLLALRRYDIPAGLSLPVKLTTDGAIDTPALNFPTNLVTVFTFEITAENKIYIYGIFNENGKLLYKLARLNADGSLDASFNVSLANRGIVNGLALQTDGKVVMVGDFDRFNGISKSTIVRVNPNGSLDASFDGGSGFDQPPRDIEIDSSGRFLVFGSFASYAGTPRSYLARLLSNGSLDTSFNPTIDNLIQTLTFQPDGKILIGGNFTNINGQAVKGIARLNADGSLDSTFAPVFGSVGQINSIFVQTDGKIMVGGSFTGVGGFNRQNLVRLNADGSLDSSFNAGTIDFVRQVSPISNGKYFVASTIIRKLNSDGTVDSNYASPSFGNSSSSSLGLRFLVLPNEGMLVIGDYNLVNNISRRGITALFPNGQIANQTYPVGANGSVFDIVRQTDGKIIIGGDFDLFELVPRSGIARLNSPFLTKITPFDFDGDGRADVSVFRASENKWYILQSSDFSVVQRVFAISGDIPTPADYDGDGKTDVSIFRPSAGDWWTLGSATGAQIYGHWGTTGDTPLPSDFDGDGKSDSIAYRASNNIWYRISSSTGQVSNIYFGSAGDKPLIGDFDGDGKSDVAIFRPSTGDWWYAASSAGNQFRAVHWGATGDIPVPADYDGDGKTDFAIYRPSNGGWYIANSSNGSFTIQAFGLAEDKPVAADYDGDGKADIAVYRPSTGTWYLLQTTAGFGALQFGNATDVPTPNAFVP
jgi:uncharacterized delta-60 repeat protein